jgi:tetratricopeptide (TPR) repeat protein
MRYDPAPPTPLDRTLLERPEMRRALAGRDIAGLYRLLLAAGVTRTQITERVGQSLPQIHEVVDKGRTVVSVFVLERIADGLGVPRGWMGLAFTDDAEDMAEAYSDQGEEEVSEEMRRRALLLSAAATLVGQPVLGAAPSLPAVGSVPTPLPDRLGEVDVTAVHAVTGRLRSVAREHGGMADVISDVAYRADRLVGCEGSDAVHRALRSALAELHTLAGWTCYDAGNRDGARSHYRRALDLAGEAGDVHIAVSTLSHAAVSDREHDGAQTALKLYELATARLMTADRRMVDSARASMQEMWLHAERASALALLDRADLAHEALAQARGGDGAELAEHDSFDRADLAHLYAVTYLDLGHLDLAEQHATAALRLWGEGDRRDGVLSVGLLALVHARAGHADAAARWAVRAIEGTAALRSMRGRDHLTALRDNLARLHDSTCQDLAQRIRLVQARV